LGSNKAIAVNIAVMCATHRNVREMIQRGGFREDLYYRLNGLVVRLPPLRDRCDIAPLVKRILGGECAVTAPLAISDEVLTLFRQYRWPGNVRQLANVLRTAAVMASDDGDTIQRHHLPDDFMEDLRGEQLLTAGSQTHNQPTTPGQSVPATPMEVIDAASRGPVAANTADADGGSLKDVQTGAIRSALQQYGGNVSAAARALGVSRNTIYRALRTIDCSGTEQAAARADTTAQNQNRAS
jgi:transcriptional regulator of acetoin/glycerol metabolism